MLSFAAALFPNVVISGVDSIRVVQRFLLDRGSRDGLDREAPPPLLDGLPLRRPFFLDGFSASAA